MLSELLTPSTGATLPAGSALSSGSRDQYHSQEADMNLPETSLYTSKASRSSRMGQAKLTLDGHLWFSGDAHGLFIRAPL